MGITTYLNFDLRIERSLEGYRAVVLSSPAGEAAADFPLPAAAELAGTDSPQLIGRQLFDAVFSGEVLSCLRRSLDAASHEKAGLRIRLRQVDVPELSDLPWECLYDRSRDAFLALSRETPVVRYLELPEPIRPLEVKPPLRVLTVLASPRDLPQLDTEREWANLQAAVGDLSARRRISIERLNPPTLAALQARLRQGEYHILHFVGHGAFDEGSDEGFLLFENEEGQGAPVSGRDLGAVLADHRSLRLAVLNACQGAQASASDPYGGVGQKLVQRGVPAVIAMRTSVSDEAAVAFSHEFYSAVADGQPVDAATSEARRAVSAKGGVGEWGTPVLFMRAADGLLWQQRRADLPRLPSLAAGVTLALLLALAAIAGIVWLRLPTSMDGRFNVAVADMGQMNADGSMRSSETGQLVGKWIFDELSASNARFEGGSGVKMWHNSLPFTQKRVRLPMIAGQTAEERAAAASALAGRIHADVVIYGHLTAGDATQRKAVLEFYVSPRVRGEADVTIGRYQLGEPITVPANFDVKDLLAKEALAGPVTGRANGLFWLLLGLREDLLGRPAQALDIFQQAVKEIKGWREQGEGKEILYFFTAREATFLKRYDEAVTAIERAIASNANYPRTQIVLGAVHLRKAQDLPAEQRLSPPQDLDQAINAYTRGLELAQRSGDPMLATVARLALGTAYRVLGETYSLTQQEGEADKWFAEAIEELGAVEKPLADAGQTRLLAQAYASMGAAYLQQGQMRELGGDPTAARRLYEQARTTYARCVEQGAKAPEDELLQSQIIQANCRQPDSIVSDLLKKLEGNK
jgi:tetratricopeptide (TPR) repeat protein